MGKERIRQEFVVLRVPKRVGEYLIFETNASGIALSILRTLGYDHLEDQVYDGDNLYSCELQTTTRDELVIGFRILAELKENGFRIVSASMVERVGHVIVGATVYTLERERKNPMWRGGT